VSAQFADRHCFAAVWTPERQAVFIPIPQFRQGVPPTHTDPRRQRAVLFQDSLRVAENGR
jgi:hypothetical protein